jgi:hypothetical protein
LGGGVSNGLEILDFDCEAEFLKPWTLHVEDQCPGLVKKLLMEKSPHGVHIIYRCPKVSIPGNTKLARKGIEVSGLGEHLYRGKKFQAQKIIEKYFIIPELIETRGEGGYCLIYPSKGYELKHGSFVDIPNITSEERDILINSARACNRWVSPQDIIGSNNKQKPGSNGLRPGDDFNERGDIRALLEKHGWIFRKNGNDGREHWARPGKDKGHSATLTDGKIFYVFSSNGHPFEAWKSYNPFGVFTFLEHDGDFSAAAKALSQQGYGKQEEKSKPVTKTKRTPCFMNTNKMIAEFGKKTEFLFREDLFPKSQPSAIAGAPKSGKTANMDAISKEVALKNPDCAVLWVCCEGFMGDHTDKWSKLGMPDNVYVLSDSNGKYQFKLDRWADQEFLNESIKALKEQTGQRVVLVAIDSLRGMQSMGENDSKIANIISVINSIVCDVNKSSLVYIVHTKKGKEAIKINRVSGSNSIVSGVREVYFVEKEGELTRKISLVETNVLGHNANPYRSVLIEDEDSFEILITEETDEKNETMQDRAEKFLISLFQKKEEYEVKEIFRLGSEEGLRSGTIKKARTKLGIKAERKDPADIHSPYICRYTLYNTCPSHQSHQGGKNSIKSIGDTVRKHNTETPKNNPVRTVRTVRTVGNEQESLLTKSNHKKNNNLNGNHLADSLSIKEAEI